MVELPPGPKIPRLLQTYNWIFRPIPFMRECAKAYGDAFTIRMIGLPPMVFFSDPAAIKQVFTGDPEHLRAGQAQKRIFKPLVGSNSILLLDGARHKRERKLLMPPFHGERLRLYGDIMCEIADRSIDAWPFGTSFPIHARLQEITLDVILRIVFGVDDAALLSRLRTLLIRWLNFNWGPLTFWKRVTQLRRIDRLLFHEIARCKESTQEDRNDILAMLVAARYDDGQPMGDEEIRDELMTVLVAGHETAATSMAWVIHHLLQNPDVLATAQAEVASVTGSGPPASKLTAEQIAGLSYLDAVIKETARLAPVVPIVVRHLEKDMCIGAYELPAGSVATPCIYLTHQRPELWSEPELFDPDRFVGRRVDPYTFFPFGGGVRHCLGAALASYEMKIVLARVLSRVTLRVGSRHRVRVVRRGITFAPSGGVPVMRE